MGDTNMCTDNPILLDNTKNELTIMCMQKKAEKTVPTEEDIIKANKLAFNDDIGTVTNRVTAMFERQAAFDKDSEEYKILSYRIMCGQHYQQCTIDRAKGIIAEPMPESWYSFRGCSIKEDDSEEVKAQKRINQRIVAERKPYFMVYVYPALRHEYRKYANSNQEGLWRRFPEHGKVGLDNLDKIEDAPKELREFLDYYKRFEPVGRNECTVNQICYLFEDKFDGYIRKKGTGKTFDYSILKSGCKYSRNLYYEIAKVYDEYTKRLASYAKKLGKNRIDAFENWLKRENIVQFFKMECFEICSNEDELCDIVVDLCYKKEGTKQFAWDICGDIIVKNLLSRNDYVIHYPELDAAGEFEYCGERFTIKQKKVVNPDDDYIE